MEGNSATTSSNSNECGNESVGMLLVTANVGSLFEDPQRLLTSWMDAFLRKVSDIEPKFLALHLQEVGGKTYEKSMEYVQAFVTDLCESDELQQYEIVRVYMDEDFKSAELFTALGNLYFVHKNVKNIKLWNFHNHSWEVSSGKKIYTGNIETVSTKEKSKFPQHFFPECKWSRKGFMRTRWEINKTVFDLVNIHLFHDASNLAACEEYPSVYCRTRRRALVHTLERFHLDKNNGFAPFFLFGDFNFRCDTEGVIKELTKNLIPHRVQSIQGDSTKVHYRNSVGHNILTVGKKEFSYADHQLKFRESWLKKFDRELEPLGDFLTELPIKFSPSYPYEEDPDMPTEFMPTRCPSWCDRVLISPQAMEIIDKNSSLDDYNVIGENVCMGDHKPVYLNVSIKTNQGIFACNFCHGNNSYIHKSNTLQSIPTSGNSNEDFIFSVCCPSDDEMPTERLIEWKPFNKVNSFYLNSNLSCDYSEQNRNYKCINCDNNGPQDDIFRLPLTSIHSIDSDYFKEGKLSHSSTSNGSKAIALCKNCVYFGKETMNHRHLEEPSSSFPPSSIFINRVDTQNINWDGETKQKCEEPYTPESVESHSPYHERSNSCSNLNNNTLSIKYPTLTQNFGKSKNLGEKMNSNQLSTSDRRGNETEQRDTVCGDQLKMRLEKLQTENSNPDSKLIDITDGGFDVENCEVDNSLCYQPKNESFQWCQNICLRKCCIIL